MATRGDWRRFVRSQKKYSPFAEDQKAIGEALKGFDESLLAHDTSISYSRIAEASREPEEVELDDDSLSLRLLGAIEEPFHELFFVNRLLRRNEQEPPAIDSHKLRISRRAFQLLLSQRDVSSTFMFALSRFYLPNGRDFRPHQADSGNEGWSFWFFLPFRVQVECSDQQRSHAVSTTGSNQMNPFHYLHLPDMGMDIRGSHIAIHGSHDIHSNVTTTICFNFMDGRWPGIVEEPQKRIAEAFRDRRTQHDPMIVPCVYLSSVARWWNNAIHSVNEQLIAYERELQEDTIVEGNLANDYYSRSNKALHAQAAHIQRYRTELDSLEDTIAGLLGWLRSLRDVDSSCLGAIEQVGSQVKATNAFVQEQEKKTQNILALLFNRMQITNDRRMEDILRASQQEAAYSRQIAKRSQELAEDMKRDSVSMKTIALMTLLFLPATSFAAVLAMPFFEGSHYLSDETGVWIWVVLTVPTTAVAYTCYYFWRKHEVGNTNEKESA